MIFVGVEFAGDDGENSVALVSSTWLTPLKREAYWPPFKQQSQFDRALRNHLPAEDSWQLYPISRCFFECDNYEKARHKIKQAEITSDIQSDADVRAKRRRVQPRRLLYDTSDEDSGHPSQFDRPPTIKISSIKAVDRQFGRIATNLVGCSTPSFTHSDVLPTPSITTDSPSERGTSDIVFQKKLFSVLYEIREQNKKILDTLNKQNATTSIINYQIPETIPVELPLSDEEGIKSLENYLSIKENFSALSSYLSTLGGRDLTTKINRILKTVLKDVLARNYSFYGKRHNKKAFSDLILKKVIIGAIKANSPNSYEKDIEDGIKVWLKHAPQRLKISQNSKHAHT